MQFWRLISLLRRPSDSRGLFYTRTPCTNIRSNGTVGFYTNVAASFMILSTASGSVSKAASG
jgi:hypothetical protein